MEEYKITVDLTPDAEDDLQAIADGLKEVTGKEHGKEMLLRDMLSPGPWPFPLEAAGGSLTYHGGAGDKGLNAGAILKAYRQRLDDLKKTEAGRTIIRAGVSCCDLITDMEDADDDLRTWEHDGKIDGYGPDECPPDSENIYCGYINNRTAAELKDRAAELRAAAQYAENPAAAVGWLDDALEEGDAHTPVVRSWWGH